MRIDFHRGSIRHDVARFSAPKSTPSDVTRPIVVAPSYKVLIYQLIKCSSKYPSLNLSLTKWHRGIYKDILFDFLVYIWLFFCYFYSVFDQNFLCYLKIIKVQYILKDILLRTMDERTFVADGVQRGLVGAIISRFEQRGYKLVAIKLINAPRMKNFKISLFSMDMTSGPICAMIWQGKQVVKTGRCKYKEKVVAIRDYAIDIGRNVCHGSDSVESAQREIGLWFSGDEIFEWDNHNHKWFVVNAYNEATLSVETAAEVLIDRLCSIELTENSSVSDRAVVISLYYIFKDTFLLALDLLDEKRIAACSWESVSNQESKDQWKIYYVFDVIDDENSTDVFKDNQKHQYEVRTSVWHCSCPEFTFSAFNNDYYVAWDRIITTPGGFWGGCILGEPMPICKHLLACVLIERGFRAHHNILKKSISKEEFILRSMQ
ncbi:hypothetical protein PORY_001755 [Pneumocystis oryctolagi]|uniref:Uncharacterized protein n=1 Tax=Pneumocystis oryctolagi TaxID=42067 RepID=A0ACB7CCB0_9ASCO|nr:hypothetical protein PORY_001755 [Pneumocystis oryctolagi]